MFEVIGRQRLVFRGQSRAAAVGKLLGMELDPETVEGGRFKQALGFFQRKADGVAEAIDGARQFQARNGWNHLVHDLVDIVFTVRGELGGQGMEREQCRHDAHRFRLVERARDVEKADFARRIESITRLDFDRRAPARHQRMETAARRFQQLGHTRRAGCRDRGGDTAPGSGNLLVGRPRPPSGMFGRPRSAEHEVGMAIDQSRRDPRAPQGDDFRGLDPREFRAAPDAHDPAVLHADGGLRHDAERIVRCADHGHGVTVDEQAVPHGGWLRRHRGKRQRTGRNRA